MIMRAARAEDMAEKSRLQWTGLSVSPVCVLPCLALPCVTSDQ